MDHADSTRAAVIIPNRNSPAVDRTLASLAAQTAATRIAEILVVGVDEPGLVTERGPVRFIRTEGPVTAPVARNIGIREATAPVLAFIDADCVADADWLQCMLAALENQHPIVGGAVSLPTDGTYRQLCYNLTMFHEFLESAPAGERRNLGTLNLAVTRRVIDDVGLMAEELRRGQDTEWTLRMRRAGYHLYFAPDAKVTHLPAVRSLRSVVEAWYVSGAFNGWIRHQYRDVIADVPFYDRPALLRLLSPAIALVVTARIFARNPRLLRYAHTAPVIFLTKVAWCLGASRRAEPSTL
jgi:GT2 family glycosyltransferase